VIPKRLHDVVPVEAEKPKRRRRAWPILIRWVGGGEQGYMVRIIAFFEERGFAVELYDERFQDDYSETNYKFAFLVGWDREEVLAKAGQSDVELAVTNRVLFTSSELVDFVQQAEKLKARSHIVSALVYYKLSKQTAEEDIRFSERSSWFRKDAEKYFENFRKHSERHVGAARERFEGLVEEEARSEELAEVLNDSIPYALLMVFMLFFGLWIYLVGQVSLYWISGIVTGLATLNMLRAVGERRG
jgi:hypothetical protein